MPGIKSLYGLKKPTHLDELTAVGRATPMGELLRRYWHPVALAEDATQTPRLIRALGEELVLFRDGVGKPGLLHPRCAHRGASLYYGKVERRGIRCCNHGWLFDTQGQCIEQPCEGASARPGEDRFRQPAYPVIERYSLIFAYLGPLERQPILPRYNVLENLGPDEWIESDGSSIGSGGPAIVPCNWLQLYENVMDPFHAPVLHGSFSGAQFNDFMGIMPTVEFSQTERGVRSVQCRSLADGGIHQRITEVVLPTVRAVADPRAEGTGTCSLLGWVLPLDDTSFRVYSAGRVRSAGALSLIRSKFNGKLWHEMSEPEHQRQPGDYEAQVSQGPVTAHSEEHLVRSDQGVGLLRRVLREQVSAVGEGRDPIGTQFDESCALVNLEAGTARLAKALTGSAAP